MLTIVTFSTFAVVAHINCNVYYGYDIIMFSSIFVQTSIEMPNKINYMKHSRFVRSVTGLSSHDVTAGIRRTVDSIGARASMIHPSVRYPTYPL